MTIDLGFLLGAEIDGTFGWDGIDGSVVYNPDELSNAVFIGRDVYHVSDSAPNLVNSTEPPSDYIDETNNWMIMAEKCYIDCDEPNSGKCKINMHFMRMQETADKTQDHQINYLEGESSFKGVVWYRMEGMNGEALFKGQSDQFEIVTLDMSESSAIMQLATCSATIVTLIAMQLF